QGGGGRGEDELPGSHGSVFCIGTGTGDSPKCDSPQSHSRTVTQSSRQSSIRKADLTGISATAKGSATALARFSDRRAGCQSQRAERGSVIRYVS
ncbi:hypothetical protein ABZS66_61330, partial [Dactylosporangium sp. NPDC005572]|uniref:hypothetical protein n=1 Tax=Dactylosporangium sp. NPDC005572 TaxID=3156889 RepID=UPI0033A4BD1E